MHGAYTSLSVCLSVTRPKFRLDNMSLDWISDWTISHNMVMKMPKKNEIASCNSGVKSISCVTGRCAFFNVKLHFSQFLLPPLPYPKIKDKQMGAVEIEQKINNWLSSEGKKKLTKHNFFRWIWQSIPNRSSECRVFWSWNTRVEFCIRDGNSSIRTRPSNCWSFHLRNRREIQVSYVLWHGRKVSLKSIYFFHEKGFQ